MGPQLYLSTTHLMLEPLTVSDTQSYVLMFNNDGLMQGSFVMEEYSDSDEYGFLANLK